MDDTLRQQAIALYDRFTHEGMERREFFSAMTRIAGGAAAAHVLIGSIAASPAAASVVAEGDKRLRSGTISVLGATPHGRYYAYYAEPVAPAAKRGTIIVVHENRGLNEHIRDVTRRLALAGYHAIAPDLLSPIGGTPVNEDAARDAIGKLDLGKATAAGVALLELLQGREGGTGRVGVIGFCWGGAYVNRLAVAAGQNLAAGVAYYGPAPSPAEASKVAAPLLLHYAGLDDRVNATGVPWVAALKAAGKHVETYTYPGVNHAFNNDTSAERYNKPAAELAWQRTLAFFGKYLR